MESFERARLDAYFAKIVAQFGPDEQATAFLVTHLLPERPAFVRAVAAMSRLRAVLPKPVDQRRCPARSRTGHAGRHSLP